MNSTEKLVAAAQRAARKLSRAEGISYQTSLDRIAISVGRSTWSSFLAAPVAVDQTAALAAAEPDFTRISPDGHLHAAIEYGGSINARALLARPAIGGSPAGLTYSSERAVEYDLPIDARGISVQAMIAAIATSGSSSGAKTVLQDIEAAYEIDDLGDGVNMQLRLSFDLNVPPIAPVAVDEPVPDEPSRRSRLNAIAVAINAERRIDGDLQKGHLLDLTVMLPALREGADVRVDPHVETYDLVLYGAGIERVIRTGDIEEYRYFRAMMKDRGRIDPMEWRYSQYGDWMQEIDGELQQIHIATEPRNGGYDETLRIGMLPFTRRNYVRPNWDEAPKGGRIPLGSYGLLHKVEEYAEPDEIIVVSGGKGSGRTGRFVIPAIMEAYGNDVVVSDMPGTLAGRLGSAWSDRGPTLHLDPRAARTRRSPAFNPFHPDMMPTNHADAASMVAEVLLAGADETARQARSLFHGIVDLLHKAPHLRPDGHDAEQPVSLPMVVDWFDQKIDDVGDQIAGVSGTAAIRATAYLQTFASCSAAQRADVRRSMTDAFAFIRNDAMRRLLDPVIEDRGADVARALSINRNPVLIIVGGDADEGDEKLVALVMESISRLRADFALRRTHFHIDDANIVGWMPWLDSALASDHGGRHSTSTSVVLEHPEQIDHLCRSAATTGKVPGVRHWLIEEIRDVTDRQRVADAMGVRLSKVSTHRPDGRRIHVSKGNARLLRR